MIFWILSSPQILSCLWLGTGSYCALGFSLFKVLCLLALEAETLLPPTTRGQECSGHPVSSPRTSHPWGLVFTPSCGCFQLRAGLLFINYLCFSACCHGEDWTRCSSSPSLPQMPKQNKANQ